MLEQPLFHVFPPLARIMAVNNGAVFFAFLEFSIFLRWFFTYGLKGVENGLR